MASDQRRSERKSLKVEFQGRDAHGVGRLHFTSADVSTGGTFLVSELLLEQGEALQLEFELPGASQPLRAQARVAWVRRFPVEGEAAGMGVEFTAMSDEDRGALAKHLGA